MAGRALISFHACHPLRAWNWNAFISGRLGSASSSSSCGSAEFMGEVIPHHPGIPRLLLLSFFLPQSELFATKRTPTRLTSIPSFSGLPRQDSGHWWTSFFFAKPNQPGMQSGSEHQKWEGNCMRVKAFQNKQKTTKQCCPLVCLHRTNMSCVLQKRNLHSDQRSGDLHRQGNGSEEAGQREQRDGQVRVLGSSNSVLDRRTFFWLLFPAPSSCRLSHKDGDYDGVFFFFHFLIECAFHICI